MVRRIFDLQYGRANEQANCDHVEVYRSMIPVSGTSPTPHATPVLSRGRRQRAALFSMSVFMIFTGFGIWYTADVIVARPIMSEGFVSGTAGQEGDSPGVSWVHVPYTPGGAVQLAITISNVGHYAAHIRQITFFGIPAPSDHYVSPLRLASPLYAPDMISGDLEGFRPFTIDPGDTAIAGWELTMCPTASPNLGGSVVYRSFGVTYSYGGWTRTDEVLLPAPLSVDNIGECDGNGTPSGG